MNEAVEQCWRRALERIAELGALSDEKGRLTRTLLSPASRLAAERLMDWMAELGMTVAHDRFGTVRGILRGTHQLAMPLLLGSHLDTAVDAGKYDGALGLVVALAALERLSTENIVLPMPLHLLGFADETGVRFHTTALASRAICGDLDKATLALHDDSGLTLARCLEREGWKEEAAVFRYAPAGQRGYVEVHIEQGPSLESLGQPAGVVTGICGQSRIVATLTGRSGHAGTTPMHLRHDALTGAAECLLFIEKTAREHPPVVATVGKIGADPGAANSIPGLVRFTVDLRHPDDAARAGFIETLRANCSAIAHRRNLAFEWRVLHDQDGIACDPTLTGRLAGALTGITGAAPALPSGAGHDGLTMAAVAPVAMLFVRCRGGLSHHPDEHVTEEDIATAIEALSRFLKSFLVGS